MKTQFIQIQDINEIDTSKTTVYDLNKRYIDKAGNMYGLRYNRETKKVEIIKVMRTTARNQTYFTQKMIENRKVHQHEHPGAEVPYNDEGPSPINHDHYRFHTDGDTDFSSFDPDAFKTEMFNAINVHRERLAVIVKNVANARLVNREQRELSIKMDDLLRNIDIDGIQRIDKIITAYHEMTEYPRSINYYLGKLESRARNRVAEITLEDKKIKFVMMHEVYQNLKDLFFIVTKNLSMLKEFVVEMREARYAKLSQLEKQSLTDAITTMDNTLSEINSLDERLQLFEEYMYHPESFT